MCTRLEEKNNSEARSHELLVFRKGDAPCEYVEAKVREAERFGTGRSRSIGARTPKKKKSFSKDDQDDPVTKDECSQDILKVQGSIRA